MQQQVTVAGAELSAAAALSAGLPAASVLAESAAGDVTVSGANEMAVRGGGWVG